MADRTKQDGVEEKKIVCWASPGCIHQCGLIAAVEDGRLVGLRGNPDYPTPEYLRSIIRMGNVEFEGDISQDTPGSDLIRQKLLDDDPRPVYIQVWGGPSTASRALKSIEEEYSGADNWSEIKAKVSEKAVLCLSGCQDTSFPDYVRPNWPDVKVMMINKGVIPIGYGAMRGVPDPSDTVYYAAEWTAENILKGPLGANYRVWGDGKQMAPGDFTDYFGLSGYTAEELSKQGYWVWTPPQRKGNFISEGDTPMFLNFIDNGLRAYEDDTWGGWAGRLGELSDREMANGYTVAFGTRGGKDEVLPDFVPAVQNSFAARMKWSVMKCDNHGWSSRARLVCRSRKKLKFGRPSIRRR